MNILIDILKVIHILSAVLMAWPYYALVAVNQRARLGPPLGDRTDIYIENIIKNRTIPCYIFQASVFISGLALVFLGGGRIDTLITNPLLGIKFVLLLAIAGILTSVHTGLQPRLDSLFDKAGKPPFPEEIAKEIGQLRSTRKRRASICLFCVLVMAMLGVQVWSPFPVWLNGVLVLAIAAFTMRASNSETPYGWA
ncbi:MAG: hypothetical protein GWN62_01570 [Aliifodinibius sp.]|nr:hypothetical protein [Fodinibius sp.]